MAGGASSRKGTVQLTDLETGETKSYLTDAESKRPRTRSNEPFAMTYLAALEELHKLGLSGRERDVLDQLIVRSAYADKFVIPKVAVIARKLGASRATVNGAYHRLRELGIIIDFPDDEILLNPRMFFRGSEVQRREWIAIIDATEWRAGLPVEELVNA